MEQAGDYFSSTSALISLLQLKFDLQGYQTDSAEGAEEEEEAESKNEGEK